MKYVNIGEILLTDTVIDAVEKHRSAMIEAHKDDKYRDVMLKADFSLYFGDLLFKYGNRLDRDYK